MNNIITNKEIGSEFWDVPICECSNSLFPKNTEWYLSGRSALIAIIKDIKTRIQFNKVALPSWCCDSMIIPFLMEGISVNFYSVYYEKQKIQYDFSNIHNCEAMLIMDYFGYIRNIVPEFKGIIINDTTHSFFSLKANNFDYTFGSLRKWAGFLTGGFAYKKTNEKMQNNDCLDIENYISARRKAMSKKFNFITGKTKSKEFLSDFAFAESFLEKYPCGRAADIDIFRAKKLDVKFVKERRRENASVLLKNLSEYAIFPEIKENDCPLFVPIRVPNEKRNSLKQYLIEHKIYCPIHWPITEYHILNHKTRLLYEQELSVVCDQRYSTEQMKIVCNKIKKFLEG